MLTALFKQLDNPVRYLETNQNFFCLLLSDAAIYMVAAGTVLKHLYPKMFHITCMACLPYNCAMKAKLYFQDLDQLPARIKAAAVKNKTRQAQFAAIGYPLSLS